MGYLKRRKKEQRGKKDGKWLDLEKSFARMEPDWTWVCKNID